MPKKIFIFQGITPKTHTKAIQELFKVPNIQQVILSVAFVSESGVQIIESELRKYATHMTIFAGIRNDITSYQGLTLLYNIGVRLHVVDTGSRRVLFHPKLYLVRGVTSARIVIGSANLTLGGLNNNIEAGMLLDFDLTDPEDKFVVEEIEAQLGALSSDYPEHVLRINAVSELDALLSSGRLVDEMAIPPPHPTTSVNVKGTLSGSDTITRIKLKITPLHKPFSKMSSARKQGKTPSGIAAPGKQVSKPISAAIGVNFELVWESKPLTRRDLTIPTAKGTHQTGSMNFDKGLLPASVDHRDYFRNDVFSYLQWRSRSPTVEEAFAKFHLVLKGISYGEFDLSIRHTKSKVSKAYQQRNAMTRLSWGPISQYIANPNLIGRTLALYRDNADPTRFILEID